MTLGVTGRTGGVPTLSIGIAASANMLLLATLRRTGRMMALLLNDSQESLASTSLAGVVQNASRTLALVRPIYPAPVPAETHKPPASPGIGRTPPALFGQDPLLFALLAPH